MERRVVYNNCCKGGKDLIAPFKEPPEFLRALLDFDGHEGKTPKYAELYIYHGGDEADNRIQALNKDDRVEGGLDKAIVKGLEVMLNTHNSLVKKFRMAKQVLEENEFANVSIRIVAPGELDGPRFNLPSTDELACLVVGELTVEAPKRDIIIRGRGPDLQRISSLHPANMSLQYPLLFPYGERGFQLGVKYIGADNSGPKRRQKMMMQDFYCFCSHYKEGQHNPYLSCGLLSDQAIVNSRACIDEARLHFILLSNDDLRAESLQGLVDEVGAGRMDGSSVDIFTTFTCNPKWPEIAEALSVEPGQRPHNRADITVRVYHMKLAKYLASIKTGKAFGKAITVLHTVEFQKRGLPHAHILVWQDKEKRGEATLALIDSFISAEIPDPVEDPLGTAHSRFKIPIDLDANGVCDIQRGTMLSSLIEASSLIIWDEALMTHRKCFEALDRSLRDVLSDHDPLLADEPFGGKVVVLGGDLRQILPRLAVQSTDTDVQDEAAAFARWVLSIGDGTVPAVARQGESDPTWITIPNEHLVRSDGDKITSIVESMYVDFLKRYSGPNYLKERAILTSTNEIAEDVNRHVLSMVPGEEREYLSCDST
ncbi:hypothetical protein ACQ4PT_041140 [Festuca glaucescens]